MTEPRAIERSPYSLVTSFFVSTQTHRLTLFTLHSTMPYTLKGRRVLVCAGSRGLGALICEKFAAEGCHIMVNYISREDRAREVVEKVRAHGVQAFTIHGVRIHSVFDFSLFSLRTCFSIFFPCPRPHYDLLKPFYNLTSQSFYLGRRNTRAQCSTRTRNGRETRWS